MQDAGQRELSCRLKPASFELTMPFLSQARPLGGLHRASPLPFRASYFTRVCIRPTLRLNDSSLTCISGGATDLHRSLIPSSRFAAHITRSLPLGLVGFYP